MEKIIINTLADIKKIKPTTSVKTYTVGKGNSLYVKCRSIKDGGKMSFVGRLRHPITKKQLEETIEGGDIRIENKKVIALSIKNIKEKWFVYREKKIEELSNPKKIIEGKTLEDASKEFLKVKSSEILLSTVQEYTRQFNNTIFKYLDKKTPLRELEWDNNGHLVDQALIKIREDQKNPQSGELQRRCKCLLNGAFEKAIDLKWIARGQNPVVMKKGHFPSHTPRHYPHLEWNEVPSFIEKLNRYSYRYAPQQLLALKLIMLTGIRTGAVVRTKWDWIDRECEGDKATIYYPATTTEIKRYKKNYHRDHYVPITKEVRKILEKAKQFSTNEYVFSKLLEGNKDQHLREERPSKVMTGMGIVNSKGEQVTSHGWRKTLMSAGKSIFGQQHEMLDRQLGHIPEGKVNQAYDFAQLIKQRRRFMIDYERAFMEMGLTI